MQMMEVGCGSMANTKYFQSGGINLYINPLLQQDGNLIRSVNMDSYPFGAKTKRAGYTTFLGTNDGSAIQNLFAWAKDDGTSIFLYKQAGSSLYYYDEGQGTATAWLQTGNGTITQGTRVGRTILNNTLIISQGGGTTRHSTTGTSFSDTSAAPAGPELEQYQNRVYITGTSSTLTYGVTGDPTNWQTTGTSDSSSFTVPGAGLPNKLFKLADRLFISKTSRQVFQWDGYQLVDTATNLGLTSPLSYGSVEDNGFWLNNLGIFSSNGGRPQLLSNAIQGQIYNDGTTGIAGGAFGTAPGIVYNYDYLLAVGSVQDDFTNEGINNAIIKYNLQKNEFLDYQFNDFPTAWTTYRDKNGNNQLIFGDSTGQVYKFGTTNLTDNAKPISAVMEYIFHFGDPHLDKEFRWFWGFFNPGCEAQIQIAIVDTFVKGKKKWTNLGDAVSGVVQYRFPTGSRGNLLYVKIIESSRTSRFTYYGCAIDFDLVDPG